MNSKRRNQPKPHFSPRPYPVSQAGVLNNLTGTWRYLRPRFEEKLSPCVAACPAGERVEAWIRLFEEGKHIDAWRLIKTANPFPRVCGRVCFHPCEASCNRGEFDRPLAIHSLERFVSDLAKSSDSSSRPRIEATGVSVGIIGSGPAGLTCAYYLALRGHDVTIYEAETELGGLLRYGIPAYRLPRDVLDDEIGDILETGIKVRTGTRVDDLERLRSVHAALFVATGMGASKELAIPGEQGEGVMSALEFLRLVNSAASPSISGKVLVIGGGNAAVDAARVALRLGAVPTIVYRRSRAEMPAYLPEVEEAEKEGIAIRFLEQPVEIVRENGRISIVMCLSNRLGKLDESGRRQIHPIEGSSFPMEADAVIVAVGEDVDNRLLRDWKPVGRETGVHMQSVRELSDGVFAGGDLTSAQRTVAHAIGSGRAAAMRIDVYLRGSSEEPAVFPSGEVVKFEDLNLDYFVSAPRARIPMISLRERERNFEEVYLNIDAGSAAAEARRCFHCGICVSCDNCLIFCPDIAVTRSDDGGYSINYDYCKGCGICVHECPRHAMSIDEEMRK